METRINSIIENILDGMITVDDEGVICSMNPAAEKMFGCINNEMVGHKFTKLVPKCSPLEPDAQPHRLRLGRSRPANRQHDAWRSAALAATPPFPIEISLSEMMVDNKQLYVAMVRDVTERKRFEQEIAAEKESLAVTLRSIGDGVITTDVQGKIIMINNAGEDADRLGIEGSDRAAAQNRLQRRDRSGRAGAGADRAAIATKRNRSC